MKKTVIAVISIAVILVGVGIYVRSQQTDETIVAPKKVIDSDSVETRQISRYVEYSKAAFDQAVDSRRVLFFYASWCPTCRPADVDLKANVGNIPPDVVVFRVNYNDPDTDSEEKGLAKKYGITYQHTFVQIDAQEKEVTRWNGGKAFEIVSNIQ